MMSSTTWAMAAECGQQRHDDEHGQLVVELS